MKRTFAVMMLLAGGVAFAQLSIGIRIGAPPPVRVVRVQPRSPGAGYAWVSGYWYPEKNRYKWHKGYWTRPPFAGARWVEPHHDWSNFHEGYWDGDRGRISHDHKWDRGRGRIRDFDRHNPRD